MNPVLYVVIPCYNEEEVLPITSETFREELEHLVRNKKINENSRILLVDDGSRDRTWAIIRELSEQYECFEGIRLSRNRGHQNALLAGLMEVKDRCDISISIDCDGQDDIGAIEKMVDAYAEGCEVVYGVRNDRQSDSFFKRFTAESFYKVMRILGADTVYNHADYRLLSAKVLKALAEYEEVNLYLRGMIPLIGFKSTTVEYRRQERQAGSSHYPLKKMLKLAINGITSLSIEPLHLITVMGFVISLLSFLGAIWAVVTRFMGYTVDGWASMTCIVCFIGGIQLLCLGVIGEYIGKIYMEVKHRPRYILAEKTEDEE